MAVLQRHGYRRDMNCIWTTVQAGGVVPDVLGGPRSSASSYLSCYGVGSQATVTSLARSTSSKVIGASTTAKAGNPPNSSIQPLATSTPARASARSTTSQAALSAIATPNQVLTTAGILNTPSLSQATPSSSQSRTTSSSNTISVIQPTAQISTTTIFSSPSTTFSSQPTKVPRPSPVAQTSNPTGATKGSPFSGAGSELGPESKVGAITSKGSMILGITIPLFLIVAALLTIFYCRRNRKKQRSQSLGYLPTTPKPKPWKRRKFQKPITSSNSEGLSDFNTRGEEHTPRRSIRVETAGLSGQEYRGKDSNFLPLTMPEQAFSPLRVNGSSSIHSGSSHDGPNRESHGSNRRRSTNFPEVGGVFGDGETTNPFKTLAELQREESLQSRTFDGAANLVLRPDVYSARPSSDFDILRDHNESRQKTGDRDTDSVISDISTSSRYKPPPLFSSPFAYSTRTPEMMRPVSLSASSDSVYTRSSLMQFEPAKLSVRNTGTDSLSSLEWNFDQEFRDSTTSSLDWNFDQESKDTTLTYPKSQAKPFDFDTQSTRQKLGGSYLRNEVVSAGGYRDSGSMGSVTGDVLQEWENEEMEMEMGRRLEEERANFYEGMIRPGMGIQKRGDDRTLGAQRGISDWDFGVQKSYNML
ncbi:uncharacterized protein RSE6_11283 [Rhynchosporium secalis]|uniref:Uncharacterized protein n=1 Tax=Rhynchosporium secalis TaxID=38038 RepID=A0A1E1MMK4_RHYSE|nr:uncharacterized protein RSE6_11283 [Rhynchosporium secalis]